MRLTTVFIIAACAALVGCPASSPTTKRADTSTLQLDVDPGARKTSGPTVGDRVQLRLSWQEDGNTALLNQAFVDNGPNQARWVVDPPNAVEIDADKAQAVLKRSGPVTIRAIYHHKGVDVESNVLKLNIQAKEDVSNDQGASE